MVDVGAAARQVDSEQEAVEITSGRPCLEALPASSSPDYTFCSSLSIIALDGFVLPLL